MEKISNLIKELQKECAQENINLVLCVSSKEEDRTISAAFGKPEDLMMNVLTIVEKIDEARKDCDCPNCKARKAAEKEREGQNIGEQALARLLGKIMRGEI